MRFALGLQYYGRDWQGWQSQPHGRTVQDALEAALANFSNAPVRVSCAGRTDSGVHALGQVVHFDTRAVRASNGWVRGVNALLPASIAVTWAAEVGAGFDARFSATARTYHYLLLVQPIRSPHWVGRAGWTHADLDVQSMQRAARSLIGQHDFSAFRSAECQAKSPLRTLSVAEVVAQGRFVIFTFSANAFLQHMVRNLVACLVAVGRGKQPVDWVAAVLNGRDRRLSAATFMPDGLYLARVDYPASFALPEAPSIGAVFPGMDGPFP